MLKVLDLFSGIGGFSLGLERTGGFETVAFCEIDPFCRKVLAKHWPGVPIHEDVCKLTATDVGPVDVICGGFPCQDISYAGAGVGIEGVRSGLWSEYARLIREIRPRYAIIENVSALLARGLDRVLGDLSEIGYDAEWHCVPASTVGAPHYRDRLWVVPYHNGIGWDGSGSNFKRENVVCDRSQWSAAPFNGWRNVVDWLNSAGAAEIWAPTDRETGRMDDGISRGLDRHDIKSLGNAVVPQVVEIIGRSILDTRPAMP